MGRRWGKLGKLCKTFKKKWWPQIETSYFQIGSINGELYINIFVINK